MRLLSGVAILALTIASAPSALAQTVMLRCDPISATAAVENTDTTPANTPLPLVITVDVSAHTVHEGEDDNSGWYSDSQPWTDDSQTPSKPESAPGAGDGYTHCSYKGAWFVQISATKVEFGLKAATLKPCGANAHLANTTLVDTTSIDRYTGILIETEKMNGADVTIAQDDMLPTSQCRVLNGRLF